ncbi:MAG: hypothetical protein AAB599_03825 [Patescibacteria group bacterium]
MVDPIKQAEREAWHKVIVKVIQWKSELTHPSVLKSTPKLTPKEWKTYKTHTLKTNANDRPKFLQKLRATEKRIRSLGGFI